MHVPIPHTGPKPTKSWLVFFFVLLIFFFFKSAPVSSDSHSSILSLYKTTHGRPLWKNIPSHDRSRTGFLHVAQTYQQDHHGPGKGQHTQLRKSVLIMMSVISSGHSALAT